MPGKKSFVLLGEAEDPVPCGSFTVRWRQERGTVTDISQYSDRTLPGATVAEVQWDNPVPVGGMGIHPYDNERLVALGFSDTLWVTVNVRFETGEIRSPARGAVGSAMTAVILDDLKLLPAFHF